MTYTVAVMSQQGKTIHHDKDMMSHEISGCIFLRNQY
jgi:hypothetical protein